MATSPPHAGLEHVLGRVIQGFMHSMQQTGLSGPQIHALLYIFHAGECRVSEIAALSDSSPAAASQLVERLVQQGLVQRTEDPANRRIKQLRLTGKSLKLIHAGVASNRYLLDLMAALPVRERQAVHTAFGYLARAAESVQAHHRKAELHAQNA